ncbi:MAG: uracil-DNA glycosylase [Dehalococcoidales bacterium]|jgi:DNA polymerase|nr:uracil-DNA glycosylase [Dehalococcoidales bacterium]MDD4229887.1 uracil-DNA glycosylase [Dehalococcoidales bacterium]MDD4465090.1 uracil-DNA glycosylase [Dehalococcoidales bacterium]MDD5402028.1 uracil-DNA glycosylase [Dehalococcoidales bacterium]
MIELNQLGRDIANCRACRLAEGRTNAVPGEGCPQADIMFIGEAPGENEDRQGRPFVGAAGKFLDELLYSIGMKRGDVYIANIIKCRPPGNRDPLPDEILACKPWLDRQIELIKPRMIVTLGRFSMSLYFPGKAIGKIHGSPSSKNGIIYFPMYHPAAALHQGGLKEVIIGDMKKIPGILAGSKPVEDAPVEDPAQQLKLF